MVECSVKDDRLLFKFGERLDTVNCLAFEKEVLEKIRGFSGCVIFDLEKVDYVASAFLRLSLMVYKEIGAGRFLLVHVSPEVKKVFKIAGFDKEIPIQ
ncbi:MAG: STAS domain-containing protein [Candidatus Omnitrophica bacterium]|nr:STAS domain-containing protein [Candidatus Omnitrophota bacterium]